MASTQTVPYPTAAIPMTLYLTAAWVNDPASVYYASGILLTSIGALLLIPSAIGVAQYTSSKKENKQQRSFFETQIAFVVISAIFVVCGVLTSFIIAPGQKGSDVFR